MTARTDSLALSLVAASLAFTFATRARAADHTPENGSLGTHFDEPASALPVHAELDVAPGSETFALRSGRIGGVAFEPFEHAVVSLGGVGARHDPIGHVSARSLDVGAFAVRRDVLAFGGGATHLYAGARGTFSMWDRTWADAPSIGKPDDEFHVCASQSDLELELGVRARELAVALFFADQGDPFHFGNGEDCLGGGAIWESSRTVGLSLQHRLPRGLELVGTVEAETSRLSHEEQAKGDAFGLVHAQGLRGFFGLRVAAP